MFCTRTTKDIKTKKKKKEDEHLGEPAGTHAPLRHTFASNDQKEAIFGQLKNYNNKPFIISFVRIKIVGVVVQILRNFYKVFVFVFNPLTAEEAITALGFQATNFHR